MLWADVFRSMIIHTANVRNCNWRRPRTVSYCGSRNSNCLKHSPRNTTVLSTCVEKLHEKVIVFHCFLLGRLGMLCWKDPWKLYFTLHKVCAVYKQHSLYSSELHFTNLTTTISMVYTLMDHQNSRPISGCHKIADITKSECESMTSIKRRVRTFHVEVVQWTSKRCDKKCGEHAGLLFRSSKSLFFTFSVAIVVVVMHVLDVVPFHRRRCQWFRILVNSKGTAYSQSKCFSFALHFQVCQFSSSKGNQCL